MSFKKFLKEYLKTLKENITKNQLDLLEQYLDQIFSKIGIDIEFTRHFHDRLNDKRNIKPIMLGELAQVFKDLYTKYGKKITELGDDIEAVLNHMRTDINIPFVLNHNKKDGSFELVSKTIMRKPDFKTSNPKIKI